MMLFCTTMHFASGRVRRKTFSLCYQQRCVGRKSSSNKTAYSQNCVSPVPYMPYINKPNFSADTETT